MHRIAFILLSFLVPVAVAADPLVPVDGNTATLDNYLWVARPLVVFADTPQDPRLAEQMDMIAEDPEALVERDVVVIVDTDPQAKSSVRTKLRPRGFMIALMEKDGTIVLRKPFPWSVRELSRAIDKLPLRKEEEAGRHKMVTD